jgi:hypothetical protein
MVYGSIIDLSTGENFFWEDASIKCVLSDLRKLTDLRHGIGWKFEGDIEQDDCDICAEQHSFEGTTAVSDFISFYGGHDVPL